MVALGSLKRCEQRKDVVGEDMNEPSFLVLTMAKEDLEISGPLSRILTKERVTSCLTEDPSFLASEVWEVFLTDRSFLSLCRRR